MTLFVTIPEQDDTVAMVLLAAHMLSPLLKGLQCDPLGHIQGLVSSSFDLSQDLFIAQRDVEQRHELWSSSECRRGDISSMPLVLTSVERKYVVTRLCTWERAPYIL